MDILTGNEVIQLNHGAQAVTYEDILNTLNAVADKYGIDLKECKQGQYKAVTQEAGQILFAGYSLRIQTADGKLYNNAQYDITLVDKVALAYVHICHLYNKMVNLYGFGLFANIDYETLRDWESGQNLRDISTPTIQKIINGQTDSIINKLYDSNNVTGQMMLANNILGWSTARSTAETTTKVEHISTLETDFQRLLNGDN